MQEMEQLQWQSQLTGDISYNPLAEEGQFSEENYVSTQKYYQQRLEGTQQNPHEKKQNQLSYSKGFDSYCLIHHQYSHFLFNYNKGNLTSLLSLGNPKQLAEDIVYNNGKKIISPKTSSYYYQQSYIPKLNNKNSNSQRNLLNYYSKNQSTSSHSVSQGYSMSKDASEFTKLSQQIFEELDKKPEKNIKQFIQKKQLVQQAKTKEQEQTQKKAQQLSPKSERSMVQRLYAEKDKQEQRKKLLKVESARKLEQQCTFQPNIQKQRDSTTRSLHSNRSKQFYEDQQYFLKKKEQETSQKQKEVLEKETEELKKRPEMSQKSKNLAEKRLKKQGVSKNIFIRLYEPEKNEINNTTIALNPSESSFQMSNATTNTKTFTHQDYKSLKSIDQKLFEDAKRRQLEKQALDKSEKKNQNESNYSQAVNLDNLQACINQFQRTFAQACINQMKEPELEQINYLEMVSILIDLGFLKRETEEDWLSGHSDSASILAQNIWQQIRGKQDIQDGGLQNLKSFALKRNLLLFLLAVQKMHDRDNRIAPIIITNENERKIVHSSFLNIEKNYTNIPGALHPDERPLEHINASFNENDIYNNGVNENIKRQPNVFNNQYDNRSLEFQQKVTDLLNDTMIYGSFDEHGNIFFDEVEILPICNLYKQLNINKMSKNKVKRIQEEGQNNVLNISNISRQLAQVKRNRFIDYLKGIDPNLNENEIDQNFILNFQQNQKEAFLEKIREMQEEQEIEECTFQPKTIDFKTVQKQHTHSIKKQEEEELDKKLGNYSESLKKTSSQSSGVRRSHELYMLSKPFNQKRDKGGADIEYEKDCDECTFQPDIHPRLNSNRISLSNPSTLQSQEKQIQRMKVARLQKQIIQEQKDRGNTFTNSQREKLFNDASQYKCCDSSSMYSSENQNIQPIQINSNLNSNRLNNTSYSRMFATDLTISESKINTPQANQGNTVNQNNKPSSFQQQYMQTQKQKFIKQQQQQLLNINNAPNSNASENSPSPVSLYTYFENQSPRTGNNSYRFSDTCENPPSNTFSQGNAQSNQPSARNTQANQFAINNGLQEEDKVPLLFVDVNIEEGKSARIVVFEGDKSEDLAEKFSQAYNLDPGMKGKLKDLLDQQINSLLTKIEEENASDSDQ